MHFAQNTVPVTVEYVEISINLTEQAVNERNSTKLSPTNRTLCDTTDREGRGKLFIFSADENRGTIHVYFTVHGVITDQQSHIPCTSSEKQINATAGAVPVIKNREGGWEKKLDTRL